MGPMETSEVGIGRIKAIVDRHGGLDCWMVVLKAGRVEGAELQREWCSLRQERTFSDGHPSAAAGGLKTCVPGSRVPNRVEARVYEGGMSR